jgi:hypothetical protein
MLQQIAIHDFAQYVMVHRDSIHSQIATSPRLCANLFAQNDEPTSRPARDKEQGGSGHAGAVETAVVVERADKAAVGWRSEYFEARVTWGMRLLSFDSGAALRTDCERLTLDIDVLLAQRIGPPLLVKG